MTSATISRQVPVAVLGATGMVGRRLTNLLIGHPSFKTDLLIGSTETTGLLYRDVWEAKERTLQQHYGEGFWKTHAFPSALAGFRLSRMEDLIESNVEIVFSSLPERAGFLEATLLRHDVTIFSNSPFRRMDPGVPLIVPEVNAQAMQSGRLIKNPNCVTSGLVLVLQPILSHYGLREVVVTTYQSLSGRGDSKYPAEFVIGNIYPLHAGEENTELYIKQEVAKILGDYFLLSVTCNRTYVQEGHFVEVRIKTEKPVESADHVANLLLDFNPLKHLKSHTNPERPITVLKERGKPRPAQDAYYGGGMSIAVGNLSAEDDVFDLRLTYVVNNLIRGAAGGALLNAELWLSQQIAQNNIVQQPADDLRAMSATTNP